MDHAGWVERNNAAANCISTKRKGYRPAPEALSPLQAKAMDILGMVYGGIYNAPIVWDKVEWNTGGGVWVTARDNGLATFDFAQLTRLVFLAHEARIRVEIRAKARGYFEISFFTRTHEGGMALRHPNLAEALADFRAYLPADHRILYRGDQTEAAEIERLDRQAAKAEPR